MRSAALRKERPRETLEQSVAARLVSDQGLIDSLAQIRSEKHISLAELKAKLSGHNEPKRAERAK
jgi:hypothetical protein